MSVLARNKLQKNAIEMELVTKYSAIERSFFSLFSRKLPVLWVVQVRENIH